MRKHGDAPACRAPLHQARERKPLPGRQHSAAGALRLPQRWHGCCFSVPRAQRRARAAVDVPAVPVHTDVRGSRPRLSPGRVSHGPTQFQRACMKKMKLVMVGNGMAGVRTLEELLKLAPDLYDITVFGAEPHPELQPHPAVAGAGRRADARRDRAQPAVDWYAEQRHHAAPGQEGRRASTASRAHRDRRRRHRGRLRPAAARHRLQPVHPAGAGQGPARRDRLPRHRRHRRDDRRRARSTSTRS